MTRRHRILESVAQAMVSQMRPVEQISDARADASAYLLRPIGALLRAVLLGASTGLITYAVTGHDGLTVAAIVGGLALVVRIVADSETVHSWAEWAAEVYFARQLTDQQRERQRLAWDRTENAQDVAQALATVPSNEDMAVNAAIADILRRYYELKATNDPMLGRDKLWSYRNVERVYGFGRQSSQTIRICKAIEKIADGYRLRPHTYIQAYAAIFGCVPKNVKRMVRVGDNPATGEPVLIPSPAGRVSDNEKCS